MVGYEPRLDVSSYHKRLFTNRNYIHSLTTPLVQVFGVEIIPNLRVWEPVNVYGSIEAFEKTHYSSDLYRRGREDPEELKAGVGSLSLICPSDVPIFYTTTGSLRICLKDNIRGVTLVDGELKLHREDGKYDELVTFTLCGLHGTAVVHGVVFRFADLFTVHIKVTETDNDDMNNIGQDISGRIAVGFTNWMLPTRNFPPRGRRLEIELFKRPSNKPLRVMAGTPIILSRSVVAAPVYSSLDLIVDLWDSNKKATRACLRFPANNRDDRNLQHIQTEYASVAVQIKYTSPYKLWSKVLHDQGLSVPRRPSNATETMISCGVEVFSVFVGGIAKEISSLCGLILIEDGAHHFSIYNRDDKDPEILPTSQLASIEVNYRAIWNMEFRMHLYLKDPDANLEVCRGTVRWNLGLLEDDLGDDPNFSYYSKRICSVLQGDDGYAAVHYSIFSCAYGASVQFELKLTTPGYDQVPLMYGTLFGRYGGYEYTTSYDKKYYQSRLFERAKKQPVRVQFGEKVAMLKSLVVVPEGSCLIIDADLRIVNGEKFKGLAEFHSNVLPQSMTLQGKHYDIIVSVQFRRRRV